MALSPRTDTPQPIHADGYRDSPPAGLRIGIALSGGGIRSAAFNLGALQAAQEQGVLDQTEYLAAVSGGNYIASALTISRAYSEPGTENGEPLWAHGSAEERYLRGNLTFLAPGPVGRVWLALSLVYGFVLNYLPFVLCAFIAGRVGGWLLTSAGLTREELRSGLIPRVLLGAIAVMLLAGFVLVYIRRLGDTRRDPPREYGSTSSERLAAGLVLAAGILGLCLVLPAVADLYNRLSTFLLETAFPTATEPFETRQGRIGIAAFWLFTSFVLAVGALGLSQRFRARRLMLAMSSLAGTGLLMVPALSSLEYATRHGLHSPVELIGPGAALIVVLVMSVCVHNRRYSMHLFYRERLNSAFALRRKKNDDAIVTEPISFSQRIYLSETAGARPRLVACCAVNVNNRDLPVGRFAESFTFEHDLSGGPLFGYAKTTWHEKPHSLHGTQLTLPSIMAVSGAALSPLMGRFTYPPLRFLMALTNVRLGVWIENPLHKDWTNPPTDHPIGRIARLRRWVATGWREPGALYVLREAFGRTSSTNRYIYLSDGGHWENLGLVELLRRHCTHILCFDATCDRTGDGLDIGRAIALARSDLGVQVDLDPRPVLADSDGWSQDTAVGGQVRYPDLDQDCRLVYAKAALTPDSSWDLKAYKTRDGQFPNHSISQQMFTDEQFEAYRTLGHQAGLRALQLLNLPEALLRPTPK